MTKTANVWAPAPVGYELTFWELIWDDSVVQGSNFPPANHPMGHAGFELWKQLNMPTGLLVDTFTINRPQVQWTNRHQERSVDSGTTDELFAFWEDKPVEPNSPWPMWRHDARRSGQAHR